MLSQQATIQPQSGVSFGFSVGDFIAAGELAFKLGKALTSDSRTKYGQLIGQLDSVQKVLLQVEDMRSANQLVSSTINALLFIASSTKEAIGSFLSKYEKYSASLRAGGSGNAFVDGYRKMRWAFKEDVEHFRNQLNFMMTSINCLVAAASYKLISGHNSVAPTYSVDFETHPTETRRPYGWRGIVIDSRLTMKDAERSEGLDPNFQRAKDPRTLFLPGQVFAVEIGLGITIDAKGKEVIYKETIRRVDEERRLKGEKEKHPLTRQMDDQLEAATRRHQANRDAAIEKRRRQQILANLPASPSSTNAKTPVDADPEIHDRGENSSVKPLPKDLRKPTPLPDVTPEVSSLVGPTLICRFVVIREGFDSCLCLNIRTYGRQGCRGRDDTGKHAMLYCGKNLPSKMDGEEDFALPSIKVRVDHPSMTLPKSSRLLYDIPCEVDHNVRVRSLGHVDSVSMPRLMRSFKNQQLSQTQNDDGVAEDDDFEPQDSDSDWEDTDPDS